MNTVTKYDEIKRRHEYADDLRKPLGTRWASNHGLEAHFDRATLLQSLSDITKEPDEALERERKALAAAAVLGEAVSRFVKIHEDMNISIAARSLLHRELVKEFKRALTSLPAAAKALLERQLPKGCVAVCPKCKVTADKLVHGCAIMNDAGADIACPIRAVKEA